MDQPFVTLPTVRTAALRDLKACFCIDISGSTDEKFASGAKCLDVEKELVQKISAQFTVPATYIAWDDKANNVADFRTLTPRGGTSPWAVFSNPETLATLKNAEVIVIITDGKIGIHNINMFGHAMVQHGVHFKAVIGIIVGENSDQRRAIKPSEVNVSVMVPAMLSNGCILYHNSVNTYIMWSCGVFQSTWKPADIDNTIEWPAVTALDMEAMANTTITIADSSNENHLLTSGYIPFGNGLFFHPNHLLQFTPSWEQLVNMPFDRICQHYRVAQRYSELLNWFKIQQDRFIRDFLPDSSDTEVVEALVNEIGRIRTSPHRRADASVTSYINTRNRVLARRYINDEEIENLVLEPRIVQLLQFFRQIMGVMIEDNATQYVESSYTTSTITSSRYRSSSSIPLALSNTATYAGSYDFDKPYKWLRQFSRKYPSHQSPQCECTICFETDVPFILIRQHFKRNDVSILIEHPTNYFYPQILCSKCATYFCDLGKDPVRVNSCAAMPLVKLDEDSTKHYMASFIKLTDYVTPSNNIFAQAASDEMDGATNFFTLLLGILNNSIPDLRTVTQANITAAAPTAEHPGGC